MTLMQLINRFSFLLFPLAAFLVAALILARAKKGRWPWMVWGALLAAFLAFVFLSGQRTTASFDTPENIRRALASADQPTLVEFFSNYCLGCVANRPAVQRLAEEWTGGRLVTLDVMDPDIRRFGDEVGFEVTPTFILYDTMGRELARWVGRAPTVEELERLAP
ncbi:MAG: thioredoxin family protein [Caldilineales bacterium]|nr:thioredoxin family protein [Caldilineales bacterium]MDW8317119.1 thioredoxin family protein [Anaerolineae bacterium]